MLWIWFWIGGGYNSANANSRDEAIAISRRIAGSTALVIDLDTLHEGTPAELSALDRQHASLFD